jgi:hypothetical protein
MFSKDKLEALIRGHMKRRPLMRAVDVYKLLYQGVFGVDHLLSKEARDFLKEETNTLHLDEQPEEPLLEEASADGSMVRVNLRPYMRRGLPLDKLFSAMEASTENGREEDLLEAWSVFRELVRSGSLVFDEREIEELDREVKPGGCPIRHHSEAYRGAYHPAYRVVKLSTLKKMFTAKELDLSQAEKEWGTGLS